MWNLWNERDHKIKASLVLPFVNCAHEWGDGSVCEVEEFGTGTVISSVWCGTYVIVLSFCRLENVNIYSQNKLTCRPKKTLRW